MISIGMVSSRNSGRVGITAAQVNVTPWSRIAENVVRRNKRQGTHSPRRAVSKAFDSACGKRPVCNADANTLGVVPKEFFWYKAKESIGTNLISEYPAR